MKNKKLSTPTIAKSSHTGRISALNLNLFQKFGNSLLKTQIMYYWWCTCVIELAHTFYKVGTPFRVHLKYFCIESHNYTYSRAPKSERSVWKTKRNLVRISDVQISDIQAVQFVRSFDYTINVQNLNKFERLVDPSGSTEHPKSK